VHSLRRSHIVISRICEQYFNIQLQIKSPGLEHRLHDLEPDEYFCSLTTKQSKVVSIII